MPVETAAVPAEADDEGMDLVPAPVFSLANLRKVSIAAALVAGVGLAAWYARRPPSNSAARDQSAQSKVAAASVQAQAPRTIEADENGVLAAPAESAAPQLPPPDPVKGLELRRQARQLLEAGQIDQGVNLARRAIEANPADPECYVLLAAGLQDQGRWAESRQVFSRCVNRSNTAINSECAYFATAPVTPPTTNKQ